MNATAPSVSIVLLTYDEPESLPVIVAVPVLSGCAFALALCAVGAFSQRAG